MSVAPDFSLQFAQRHDSQIFTCLATLHVSELARAVAIVTRRFGHA